MASRSRGSSPGEITLTTPYGAAYTQQHGFVHAGIVATALDNAYGGAAFSLKPEDAAILAVEFKLNLLAPARAIHSFLGARS